MDHFTQLCAEMPLKMQSQFQSPSALAQRVIDWPNKPYSNLNYVQKGKGLILSYV